MTHSVLGGSDRGTDHCPVECLRHSLQDTSIVTGHGLLGCLQDTSIVTDHGLLGGLQDTSIVTDHGLLGGLQDTSIVTDHGLVVCLVMYGTRVE